jgi:transcriptional regulator with XRE-family HTH domain
MWRDRIIEIKKEKGMSTKILAERSGISEETITRMLTSKNLKTDAPRLTTLIDLCNALEVEVWDVFYTGEKSLVLLQAEVTALREERDTLIAENGALRGKVDLLRDKVDSLKDEIISTHNYYIKREKEN